MDDVDLAGEMRLSRRQGEVLDEGLVTMDMTLTTDDAVIRIGSIRGGESAFRGFRHRVSLWTLREIDAAIASVMHANRPVSPLFKDETVTRSTDPTPPPDGYLWCPDCKGCLERSQICATCDGDRVVRHDPHDHDPATPAVTR